MSLPNYKRMYKKILVEGNFFNFREDRCSIAHFLSLFGYARIRVYGVCREDDSAKVL